MVFDFVAKEGCRSRIEDFWGASPLDSVEEIATRMF
jgi:hypothetical protein